MPVLLFGAFLVVVCARLIRKLRSATLVDDYQETNQDEPQAELTLAPAVSEYAVAVDEGLRSNGKMGSSKAEEKTGGLSASEVSREQRIRAEIEALHRARVEQRERIEAKTVARNGTREPFARDGAQPERRLSSVFPEVSRLSRELQEEPDRTQSTSSAESAEDFRFITSLFDDSSSEVRNLAARALYHLHSDRAASFTRALREGPPERRRRIAAAIESSGLATDALASLAGQDFDKSYDAFSMLFLLAKTGEMQLLLKTVEESPNLQVRLAVVKLLSLSGQPEVVQAFRRLALRGALPPEVRAAILETIHPARNF